MGTYVQTYVQTNDHEDAFITPRKMKASCGSDAYVATNRDEGVAPTKYADDFNGKLRPGTAYFPRFGRFANIATRFGKYKQYPSSCTPINLKKSISPRRS